MSNKCFNKKGSPLVLQAFECLYTSFLFVSKCIPRIEASKGHQSDTGANVQAR